MKTHTAMFFRFILLISGLAVPLIASAEADLNRLLRSAVVAPDGRAEAMLEGDLRDRIQHSIHAPATVEVRARVRTKESLAQQGCKRLLLEISTPDYQLPTTDGKLAPFAVSFLVGMCPNGSPPTQDINFAQMGTYLTPAPPSKAALPK